MKACKFCGNTTEDSVSFCTRCGASVFNPILTVPEKAEGPSAASVTSDTLLEQPVPGAPAFNSQAPEGPKTPPIPEKNVTGPHLPPPVVTNTAGNVPPVVVPSGSTPPIVENTTTESMPPTSETGSPTDNRVVVATPITPPETPPEAVSIPGNAYSFLIRDRIRKLAASGISEALEMISGIQFALVLILLGTICIVFCKTIFFKTLLRASIVILLPFLFLFIEGSVSHSSAKKAKKNMTHIGIFFGTIGNIINTVYSGIFLVVILVLLITGKSFILTARDTLIGYLPAELSEVLLSIINSVIDVNGITSGIQTGVVVALIIPFCTSLLWFITYIMIDVAHTRTIGAIKCESLKKPPVVLPSIILIVASILALVMFLLLAIASPAAIVGLLAAGNPLAVIMYFVGISIFGTWTAGFMVKAIMLIKLRKCFRK